MRPLRRRPRRANYGSSKHKPCASAQRCDNIHKPFNKYKYIASRCFSRSVKKKNVLPRPDPHRSLLAMTPLFARRPRFSAPMASEKEPTASLAQTLRVSSPMNEINRSGSGRKRERIAAFLCVPRPRFPPRRRHNRAVCSEPMNTLAESFPKVPKVCPSFSFASHFPLTFPKKSDIIYRIYI